MKERPILMSGPMVKAILENRKWQTRRVVKPQPIEVPITNGSAPGCYLAWPNSDAHLEWQDVLADTDYYVQAGFCPHGKPGDRLWVRETWNCIDSGIRTQRQDWVRYRATDGEEMHWRPSIFMPRWACRLVLNLEAVRVERLQDISPSDCRAEGIRPDSELSLLWRDDVRAKYHDLWNELNAKRGHGWDSNPWVWVLTFEQVTP